MRCLEVNKSQPHVPARGEPPPLLSLLVRAVTLLWAAPTWSVWGIRKRRQTFPYVQNYIGYFRGLKQIGISRVKGVYSTEETGDISRTMSLHCSRVSTCVVFATTDGVRDGKVHPGDRSQPTQR